MQRILQVAHGNSYGADELEKLESYLGVSLLRWKN